MYGVPRAGASGGLSTPVFAGSLEALLARAGTALGPRCFRGKLHFGALAL